MCKEGHTRQSELEVIYSCWPGCISPFYHVLNGKMNLDQYLQTTDKDQASCVSYSERLGTSGGYQEKQVL